MLQHNFFVLVPALGISLDFLVVLFGIAECFFEKKHLKCKARRWKCEALSEAFSDTK